MTTFVQLQPKKRMVEMQIDGRKVQATEGTTILDACRQLGEEIPTLCFLDTLHPVNVCRVSVVELEGSRVLVPACARKVAAGKGTKTNTHDGRPSPKRGLRLPASLGHA